MDSARNRRQLLLASSAAGMTVLLAACTTPVAPPPPVAVLEPEPAPPPAPVPLAQEPQPDKVSAARTPRDYRRDAASHLYALNTDRIFRGRLPPMLYAVAVLQVEVDRRGQVASINWMRAPRHAPEVVAEIERTVKRAAPFPAPVKMGRVTYTETWLWHKSGRFQLDTLTEGQA